MKRFVLDTNSILRIIKYDSVFHIAWEKFGKGEFELCVTTEILLEYDEILHKKLPSKIADSVMRQIQLAYNVVEIEPDYKFNLIVADYDDNKFVDCAIAANAEYIVSDDKHYKVLENIDFPIVIVKKLQEFICDLKGK